MTRVFLALGSNLGDRAAYLRSAVDALPDVVACSDVFETGAVGGPAQGAYLNMVVELDTELGPYDLLAQCRALESAAERVRVERWGPRTLDVDVLWIDGVSVSEPDLEIPHPRMGQRSFVLEPLAQLAPDVVASVDVRSADHDERVERLGPLA